MPRPNEWYVHMLRKIIPECLPSFLLVGGVAGLEGCTLGGAGFAVVDTLDTDDLAGGCDMMGVTVTTGDTGYL